MSNPLADLRAQQVVARNPMPEFRTTDEAEMWLATGGMVPGCESRVLGKVDFGGDSAAPTAVGKGIVLTDDLAEANVVTSLRTRYSGSDPRHAPVIDLDVPVSLIPSSTPGHHHLYIDVAMTWEQYRALLRALVAAGVVEQGYLGAAEQRGFTCVRLPWVHKITKESELG